VRDRANRYLTVLARGLIIRDENGTAIRFVGSLMDITQRRRQEEELRIAHRAAKDATEAKSLFLANMSHEIRTPLTTVIGGTEMMLDSTLNSNQEKLMGRVHRAGERLLKLVDDLLDFSKIEAGQIRVDTVPFNPATVVQQTALWAQDACTEKGLEFRLTTPETLSQQLMGDPHRLGQVLTNLIGNAVKFTSSGHVHLTVRAEGENARSRRLSFTVEDTGPGISPDHQTHIFQPFSQADPSITRHFGGSGLGLAIAKDIVEFMGGSLGVDSRPGQGSRFFFEVPFAVPSTQAEATRTA
jgi:signal transduction histidine kinase